MDGRWEGAWNWRWFIGATPEGYVTSQNPIEALQRVTQWKWPAMPNEQEAEKKYFLIHCPAGPSAPLEHPCRFRGCRLPVAESLQW